MPLCPSSSRSCSAFVAPASKLVSVPRADVKMFYSGPVTGNFYERNGLPLPGAAPKKKAPKKKAPKKK